MTEAKKSLLKDPVILGGGVVLVGTGLYLMLRKPAGAYLGDTLTFSKVDFWYQGPAANLWICWGLRDGRGDYNDGENLVAGLWVSGGPMVVEETAARKRYLFIPEEDFDKQPEFYMDPDYIEPRNYESYVWIANEETANEDAILRLIRGARIDLKE